MMADGAALPFRNIPTQLDRHVRNALAAVQNVRLENGAGRASVQTARARAAPVGNGCVIVQFELSHNAPQEKPRSCLLINDACILAEPSHTGILCVNSLKQWSCIDVNLR